MSPETRELVAQLAHTARANGALREHSREIADHLSGSADLADQDLAAVLKVLAG